MTTPEGAWPTLDDFRRMTAAEINAFFEANGVSWRVRDDYRPTPTGTVPPLSPEECGAPAIGGDCILPRGHNMGRVDIPEYHQAASAHPLTEAGRKALPWLSGSYFTGDPAEAHDRAVAAILAIEAEAAARTPREPSDEQKARWNRDDLDRALHAPGNETWCGCQGADDRARHAAAIYAATFEASQPAARTPRETPEDPRGYSPSYDPMPPVTPAGAVEALATTGLQRAADLIANYLWNEDGESDEWLHEARDLILAHLGSRPGRVRDEGGTHRLPPRVGIAQQFPYTTEDRT